MVSAAAGMARHGLLPVVNSFASFLASRANEQIYNQASEQTKVIYALHYAGLIPAGPGKSHQSVRDISLLGALPNMTIVQPANAEETRAVVRWAVEEAEGNVAIRLAIGPSPRRIELDGELEPGRGRVVREGSDAVLFAYGPVMLHEALLASELLADSGFGLAVMNLPWLGPVDATWLAEVVDAYRTVLVLEDHAPVGALGDTLRRTLGTQEVTVFGVEGWPACGTPRRGAPPPRPRRGVARGSHRGCSLASAFRDDTTRLDRPSRSALDPGLLRHRDRRRAAAAARRGDCGRVPHPRRRRSRVGAPPRRRTRYEGRRARCELGPLRRTGGASRGRVL